MKGHKRNKSLIKQEETINDDRFKEVYSDPRFMKVPQKIKKV